MVLPFARGRSRANDAPPTWVFAVPLIVPRGDGAKLAPQACHHAIIGRSGGLERLCTFNERHVLNISDRYNQC